MDPVLSGTFNSGQPWVLPLNTWVSPKTTADHAQSKVHRKVQVLGCGVTHHIASLVWKISVSQLMFATTSLRSCPHCSAEQWGHNSCSQMTKKASFWTYRTWESSNICQEGGKKQQYYQQGIKIMATECHTILSVRTEHVFLFLIIYLQIHLKQHIPTFCIGSWQLTHQSNQTLMRNYQEFNFPPPRLVLIMDQGCVKFIKFVFTYCTVSQPHHKLLAMVSLIARGLYFAFSAWTSFLFHATVQKWAHGVDLRH